MTTERDANITATGIRKRTKRGKKRTEELRIARFREERRERESVQAKSEKYGRGEQYKKCRKEIREAADRGEEYLRYTITDFWAPQGTSVHDISEALAAKLKKAGFKTTVIRTETEQADMGDSAAPCRIDIVHGGVEISWGPGEEHNKPQERYW